MRIRVAKEEIEYYEKAKRDGKPVRYQGASWRVLGITTDMMAGNVGTGLQNPQSGRRAQWWVEIIES
jgi:hypothetical protein